MSPCMSCTWREMRRYFFSNRSDEVKMGTAAATMSRPSGQYIRSNSTVTVSNCTMFMTRNSRPKPENRRMVDRSVVARDSNWPDCQSPWKLIGSRCRCR